MRDRCRGACSPRGFTIVELLVAMMLVAVGLLSLVGANTLFIRRRTEARQRLSAVATVVNRTARLSNAPCVPTSGASSNPAVFDEHWSVLPRAGATREIADSVRFGSRGSSVVVLRTRLPC